MLTIAISAIPNLIRLDSFMASFMASFSPSIMKIRAFHFIVKELLSIVRFNATEGNFKLHQGY